MFLEFNEMHQISDSFVALLIGHHHILIIKFMHTLPSSLALSDTHNDDTQR